MNESVERVRMTAGRAGRPGLSLGVRAALAVVLTIGFYLLAVAVVAALLLVAVAEVMTGRVSRVTVFAVVGALALAWSIVPRPQRFQPPGPRIDPAAHPHLAVQLADVAKRVGEPMPQDIYLTLEMNAGVSQRGGLLGLGATRFMVLGLPLLQLLTVSELRAVLAHEFGHFQAGDTSLGPWIFSARRALARTLRAARGTSMILWLPFRAYATVFLRVTQAVSRTQEYSADRLAASAVGAAPMAAALRKLAGGSTALRQYLREELYPTVAAGFGPPVAEGFLRYMTQPSVRRRTAELTDEHLASPATDPWDSHPPTARRLAALAGMQPGPDTSGEPAAVALLSQLPQLEKEALATLRPPGSQPLLPMSWEQVGEVVILPAWREQVIEHSALLAGATLGNLPEWAAAAAGLGARLPRPASKAPVRDDQLMVAGVRLLAMAAGVALAAQGWQVESLPGEPVTFRRGEQALVPFQTVSRLATGRMEAAAWYGQLHELGLLNAWLAVGP